MIGLAPAAWLLFNAAVLLMAVVLIARTLPEWWRTVGDVLYQRRHDIR